MEGIGSCLCPQIPVGDFRKRTMTNAKEWAILFHINILSSNNLAYRY